MLPLLLTDPNGFAVTASTLGQVYGGMSLVQVLGSQPIAALVDKFGKVPMMVSGCGLVSTSIIMLTQCDTMETAAAALGFWALGSTFLSTAPISYVADLCDDKTRAQAIALLRTCGDFGFVLGSTTTGALADFSSVAGSMQASGSFLFLSTLWYFSRNYINTSEKLLLKSSKDKREQK